jgi:hypothetical protein
MPDVDANRSVWDGSYEWPEAGDEWSTAWGDTATEWHATLLPRVHAFLPAGTILEIAPGFGRWSHYLIPQCDRYVGVDLAAASVEACRKRFAGAEHAEFHVNDGRSLDAVADTSVDLAFSFDSLVHIEQNVMGAYLKELTKKLTANGVAFIHHSNLGGVKPTGRSTKLAVRAGEKLRGRETVGPDHWRGTSMSAQRFAELAEQAGLVCIGQEVINWLGSRLIDCISMVTLPGSKWERPNVLVSNPHFMTEAASAACVSRVYTSLDRAAAAGDPAVSGAVRYFGPSSTMITNRTVGPWAVSVLGPWPKWRQMLRREGRNGDG